MTRKSFLITLAVLILVISGLIVLNRAEDNRQTWDSVHPFVNTRISWEQSFHAGAWSDAE